MILLTGIDAATTLRLTLAEKELENTVAMSRRDNPSLFIQVHLEIAPQLVSTAIISLSACSATIAKCRKIYFEDEK